jgi:aminoglycoside phosphotransferase (APT) family kinase protein
MTSALAALVQRCVPGAQGIAQLQRLTAGATQQTWSFDAVDAAGHTLAPLILRRSPGGQRVGDALNLGTESALVQQVGRHGVPVAQVLHTLAPGDGLGEGFVMRRLMGETIVRKIQRDAAFATARARLVAQLGSALGAIHRVPLQGLPTLPVRCTAATLAHMQGRNHALSHASAVFEFALRWLHQHLPPDPPTLALVHGDFRMGNMMVDGEGLVAVLDWELAHLGDLAEDLAWISVAAWRFGQLDQAVGGVGQRADFWAAWQVATGQPVDAARVHWWQVMGNLTWGLMCAGMHDWFATGRDTSVERAMIARRVSENELDLLRLLDSKDPHA